ncbi:MAG: hypothetical protein KC978_12585 [Candidatus Omnitrophica bacterium]|nr:hypothetical protein [Candidatus Omnitrophota bacterium]
MRWLRNSADPDRIGERWSNYPGGRFRTLVMVAILFLLIGIWCGSWIWGSGYPRFPSFDLGRKWAIFAAEVLAGIFGFLSIAVWKFCLNWVAGLKRTGLRRGIVTGFFVALFFTGWLVAAEPISRPEGWMTVIAVMVGTTVTLTMLHLSPLWVWGLIGILAFPVIAAFATGPAVMPYIAGWGGAILSYGAFCAPDGISIRRFFSPSKGAI